MIRATKSVVTSGDRTTVTYHSARLKTLGKFSKYHGIFEARMKLDIQQGGGRPVDVGSQRRTGRLASLR